MIIIGHAADRRDAGENHQSELDNQDGDARAKDADPASVDVEAEEYAAVNR